MRSVVAGVKRPKDDGLDTMAVQRKSGPSHRETDYDPLRNCSRCRIELREVVNKNLAGSDS